MSRWFIACVLVLAGCGAGHTRPDSRAPKAYPVESTTTTISETKPTRPVGGVTREACWAAGLHAAYVDEGTWSGSGQIICLEAVNPWDSDEEQ